MQDTNSDYRLITVYFPPGPDGRYNIERLLKVYKQSAKRHNVALEVVEIETPESKAALRFMDENTAKLNKWKELIDNSDKPVILTDSDMMLVDSDLGSVFDGDFDVGITKRTGNRTKLPLNGGFVALKPTKSAREFMRRWKATNDLMMVRPEFHKKWRGKYAGINQAALGYLLDTDQMGCKFEYLPCRVWNAVDEDWESALNGNTKLVHVKGKLRTSCLNPRAKVNVPRGCDDLIKLWQNYEKELTGK